jgi:hypothetical protein
MKNKNTVKGPAGAPAKPVLVPSRGKFSVDQAFQLNVEKGNKVCKLTVRKFVESSAAGYRIVKKNGVAKKIKVAKILTLLDEVAKKETAGRPNFLYTRVAGATAPTPTKATKPVKTATVVTPAVTTVVPAAVTVVPQVVVPVVSPAPEPVVAPANTEAVPY